MHNISFRLAMWLPPLGSSLNLAPLVPERAHAESRPMPGTRTCPSSSSREGKSLAPRTPSSRDDSPC
ncbi:hypothetical protein DL93DRAFT_2086577 [Clavulina sp. PMI_390]|nr:hypothetical protein DL93DRAFT_2086577 [Clavulina sp. PMI_390]